MSITRANRVEIAHTLLRAADLLEGPRTSKERIAVTLLKAADALEASQARKLQAFDDDEGDAYEGDEYLEEEDTEPYEEYEEPGEPDEEDFDFGEDPILTGEDPGDDPDSWAEDEFEYEDEGEEVDASTISAARPVSVTIDVDKAVKILGLERDYKHLDETISDMAADAAGGIDYDITEDDDDYDEDADSRSIHEAREEANMEARQKIEGELYQQWLDYIVECFESIETHGGGSVEAEATRDGRIELTIHMPGSLFPNLIEGDGTVGVGEEDWEDEQTVKSHLGWLGSFWEIYGERKPSLDLRA